MTMHLLRGFSTLNTRKPKFKLTKAKEALWRQDLLEYNRDLRSKGQSRLTWEQYVDMRLGKVDKTNAAKFVTLKVENRTVYNTHADIPSLNTGVGNTDRRESMKYTGSLVKGIATMHKSNAVPVIDEEQMRDIARMRRG